MSHYVHPETLARIEESIPTTNAKPLLDIWRGCGGISHQHVKNGLRALLEKGRVLRTQEIVNKRPVYHYRRVRG